MWELLTKTNVNRSLVTPDDMRTYKSILELTSGHLSGNDPSGHIKTTRGPKYRDVISELFPTESRRRRGSHRQQWTPYRQWTDYITSLATILILVAAKSRDRLLQAGQETTSLTCLVEEPKVNRCIWTYRFYLLCIQQTTVRYLQSKTHIHSRFQKFPA